MWSIAGLLFVFLFLAKNSVWGSTRDYSIIPTSDHTLCSPIQLNAIYLDSLNHSVIVTEGKYVNNHNTLWEKNDICNFRMQSMYPKSGLIAVVQRMNLRRDENTKNCLDYIEFRGFGSFLSPFKRDQHCGVIDRYSPNFNSNDLVTFYDPSGEITVEIFVSRIPLEAHERVEYEIVFTPFVDCSKSFKMFSREIRACDEFRKVCIHKIFFGDSALNCPFVECIDEHSCKIEHKDDSRSNLSTESRVFIGSMSLIFIMFLLFILSLWVFKKHKLLCWTDQFAHPRQNTPPITSNAQRVELSDNTATRLAHSQAPLAHSQVPLVQTTTLPIERDKDLPPSYDSLFPETPPPSIHDVHPTAPAAPPR